MYSKLNCAEIRLNPYKNQHPFPSEMCFNEHNCRHFLNHIAEKCHGVKYTNRFVDAFVEK